MEIVMRKVSELTPYAQNTKKHDQKQISNVANSIKRFGWQQPIVIDENGVVVIGHCRLSAAKKLRMTEVPCTIASGLTDEEVRELRIADNKTNESAWDLEMLSADLSSLTFDGFDFDFKIKNDEWFERNRENDQEDVENEEYNAFLEKFKQKKTTDDCYTPSNIYQAVCEWVEKEYGVSSNVFVRPFFPGGDYEHHNYPEGCVVVDNPPFSILSEIIRFYCDKSIRFFLFAPALTLFSARTTDVTYIATGAEVTYENGACISTSFVTNMDSCKVRSSGGLYSCLKKANDKNLREMHAELPQYAYPDHVLTAALVQKFSKYGVDYRLYKEDCTRISALDEQKEEGKAIFGSGFLLSEKASAEKAAAEKAAAEKAAAEKENRRVWKLSEREMDIVRKLGAE